MPCRRGRQVADAAANDLSSPRHYHPAITGDPFDDIEKNLPLLDCT